MDRKEANARIAAAVETLVARGWTKHQLDALLSGLGREEAVEAAERAALDTDQFIAAVRGMK